MEPLLQALVKEVLDACADYIEFCRRPTPWKVPEALQQVHYAEARPAAQRLEAALHALMRLSGAMTPHGLVSRRIAPVIDIILPPGQGGWDER